MRQTDQETTVIEKRVDDVEFQEEGQATPLGHTGRDWTCPEREGGEFSTGAFPVTPQEGTASWVRRFRTGQCA